MEHNEITRKLLSMNKRFFRNLHEKHHFDFEGRIGFFRIDGKFTLNTVKKLVTGNGFSSYATCLVFTALKTEVKKGLWAFKPVKVNLNNTTFDLANESCCYNYWCKSDFDDIRKRNDIVSFVIVQDWKDTKSRAVERSVELNRKSREQIAEINAARWLSRFRVIRVCRNSEEGWISSVTARNEIGKEVELYCDYGWNRDRHITDLNEIVDGSGYVMEYHHANLARRLKKYREMKANRAYAQTDNSDKVVMINALVSARKTILDAQFKNVKTSEEVYDFISKLYDFRNVLEDVEYFSKHTAEKTYASIERSEQDYNRLLKKLTA